MKESATTATRVEQKVANMVGPTISAALPEPKEARTAMIVAGTNVKPAVLMARNVHMASLAVSFLPFSSCNSPIALSPKGVAALPIPSILALMFIKIAPIAGWPLGTPGNNLPTSGCIRAAKDLRSPDFSAILAIPSQKVRIPINPKILSTADPAEEATAVVTTLAFPVNKAKIIPPAISNTKIKFT
jgi:hypothetical protein